MWLWLDEGSKEKDTQDLNCIDWKAHEPSYVMSDNPWMAEPMLAKPVTLTKMLGKFNMLEYVC